MKTFNLRRGRAAQQGFTLLELLVVLLIIALLAGYVGPKLFSQVDRAKVRATQAQMKTLGDALVQYRLDVGSYPSSDQGLQALVKAPQGVSVVRPVPGEGRARRCVGAAYQLNVPGRGGEPRSFRWARKVGRAAMGNWSMASGARAALAVACLLSASAASAAPDCWRAAGQRHGIDPCCSMPSPARSRRSMRAINRNRDGSHDIGLMQINSMHLPDLARQGITRQRLLDEPCLSIDVGASILSGFIRRHGRTWRAVGAYNAGSASDREAARTRYVERVWPLYLELAGERERRRRAGG